MARGRRHIGSKIVGERIRKKRHELGLSLKALAEELNIGSYYCYRDIETGLRAIRLDEAIKISNVLGLRLEDLVDEQ